MVSGVNMSDQEKLKSELHYDPLTGLFTRLNGKPAGCLHAGKGRIYNDLRVAVLRPRFQFRAHRLVWLYMTGEWPAGEIDHINGNGADNRWANLRVVSHRQNTQN